MNAMVKPQSGELAPISQPASDDSRVLMMIVQKMSEDPDFDIDKVKQMIEIKERLDATAARKAYAADMAEFKKVAPTITKDRHVFFKGKDGKPDTSYDHASLGNVVETAIAKLAEFGFSHRWTAPREGDRIVVTCTLTHRMGHSESETQDGAPDATGSKSTLQASASTRTFLERYTFLAVTGLATKAQLDDDGRGGGEGGGEEEQPDKAIADPIYDKIDVAQSVAELTKVKPEIEESKVQAGTKRNLKSAYNAKLRKLNGVQQ
jgi:hypothetical protein